MKPVNIRKQERRCQHEEQDVTQKEVGAPQTELDNLDHKLSCRLGHDVRPQTTTVPFAGPPSPVSLAMLEFTREEHLDKDLVQGMLDSDDSDETEHGMEGILQLQEPLKPMSGIVFQPSIRDLLRTQRSRPCRPSHGRWRPWRTQT